MTEIEYRIADLINFSSTQKPIEFGQAFNEIMSTKVADIIADKKITFDEIWHASIGKCVTNNDRYGRTTRKEKKNMRSILAFLVQKGDVLKDEEGKYSLSRH